MENGKKTTEKQIKAEVWAKMMNFGLEFAAMIALPLLGAIYLGKWLDTRYHQKFFVLIGIFLALGLSSYLIYRKIKEVKDLIK